MTSNMQRAATILALALISTPGLAQACTYFSMSDYRYLAKHLNPEDEQYMASAREDVADLLGCRGDEVSNDGETREVVYQNPDGATIAIRWHGSRIVKISQSGL